jgi:transcription elongation factor GreB
MSRAFVKELDEQADKAGLVRPQSPHVYYVTPTGLHQLEEKVGEWALARNALVGKDDLASQQALRECERELAYYVERVNRAVLVDPDQQPDDVVHFGAAVLAEDEEGTKWRVVIVGEDEADAAQGRISWVSPLAKALLNARVGDVVNWQRPAGNLELEILSVGKA